ncbi:recombination-associated protein RdgC, partial [Klebsiella pneumoniae]|uniref:recombination-associated protein RdgC n=1 Tax=Klebsiella pneumoniae TaxID=573 RepID=UPI001FEF20A9
VKTGNNARNGGKNSLNRLIRCVCGKKIGPDPRNFNQRVSLGRNDLLIRTFPKVQLCKQAFIKSSLILALYNTEENLLIINSANKNIANLVGAMLVKVIGSVKTVTINISDIKNGLTTRLKNHLDGEESAFAGFEVGDYVQLSRLAEQKEVIRYSAEHTSVTSEILESLNTGFIVDNMELRGCGVSFLLTDKFHFRRIDTKDNDYSDDDDKAYRWRHQAGTDMFQFCKVINQLCDLLAYKEPEEQKPAA